MDAIGLSLSDDAKTAKVREYLAKLHLDDATAVKIKSAFLSEMDKGMKDGLKSSCLQMENTFVVETTTTAGAKGKFMALDLGGSNFRVILLELTDGLITREEVAYYTVVEAKRLGPGARFTNV
jgi:hexokinase